MTKERAGKWITNLSGALAYTSYQPSTLPPNPPFQMTEGLIKALVEANKAIAYFDGLTRKIPDMHLFVSMYVRKEALLSSQIEGTQCTLEDIFDPTRDVHVNLEVEDVVNYVKALEYGVERCKVLPLCNRLVREIHAVLLANVRGREKNPGEFRRSQNWIGGAGSTLQNARYIPPNVEDMEKALGAWEQYLHMDDGLDPLIQAALLHYQFETIHPFLDGNGRVGRLLVILFFLVKGILSTPALYLSYYLKLNRVEYYDRMTQVRETGDYEQWVRFFLEAVGAAAKDGSVTIERLASLREKNNEIVEKQFMNHKKENIKIVLDYLHKSPIVEVGKTAKAVGLAYNTVAAALENLYEWGIIRQEFKGRSRIYIYEDYLSILRTYTL